jgi:hypothetical protein
MNIIELAKQAGMVYREFEDEFANNNTDGVDLKTMQAFAKLVVANIDPKSFMSWQEGYEAGAAHEREACAKLCETTAPSQINGYECAAAIRARGTT